MRNAYPFAAAPRNFDGQRGFSPGGQMPAGASRQAHAEAVRLTVQRAVARLAEIIDQETAALREHGAIDLKDYNNRKAHGLLELDRALGMLNGETLDSRTRGMLDALREKLNENARLLAIHIEAVREVATVIADTVREAESDGTYTHAYRSKG